MFIKIAVLFSIVSLSYCQPYTSGYGRVPGSYQDSTSYYKPGNIYPETVSDCPNPQDNAGTRSCSSDVHCGFGQRCCPGRRGYPVCTPVMPVRNEKPGQCPKYGPNCNSAQNCLYDFQCPYGKKCCAVGFRCKVCVNPVHYDYHTRGKKY